MQHVIIYTPKHGAAAFIETPRLYIERHMRSIDLGNFGPTASYMVLFT